MNNVLRSHFLAKSSNSTAASFTSKIPTLTEPTGDGVFTLASTPGSQLASKLKIIGFGTDAGDETFLLKVIGWNYLRNQSQNQHNLWVPVPIFQGTFTLGTAAGIANTGIGSSNLFADTIAITLEPTLTADVTRGGISELVSPANNTVAHVIISLCGFQKIEIDFDRNSSAASANALLQLLG